MHACAITELAFVRVSLATGLQAHIGAAKSALDALKASSRVRFDIVSDDVGATRLPSFVKTPQAITDGHLIELAKKYSMKLVALDRSIPGAVFIG